MQRDFCFEYKKFKFTYLKHLVTFFLNKLLFKQPAPFIYAYLFKITIQKLFKKKDKNK